MTDYSVQQKGIRKRAYAATLSLLGGKRSNHCQIGNARKPLAESADRNSPDPSLQPAIQADRARQTRTKRPEKRRVQVAAAILPGPETSAQPISDCPPEMLDTSEHDPLDHKSSSIPCRAHSQQSKSKIRGSADRSPENTGKTADLRAVVKGRATVRSQTALEPVGGATNRSNCPPVDNELPKQQVEAPLEDRVVEAAAKIHPNCKGASKPVSAPQSKAELLKDLVAKLEGRAEKVALDLRLEYASKMRRESSKMQTEGNDEAARKGRGGLGVLQDKIASFKSPSAGHERQPDPGRPYHSSPAALAKKSQPCAPHLSSAGINERSTSAIEVNNLTADQGHKSEANLPRSEKRDGQTLSATSFRLPKDAAQAELADQASCMNLALGSLAVDSLAKAQQKRSRSDSLSELLADVEKPSSQLSDTKADFSCIADVSFEDRLGSRTERHAELDEQVVYRMNILFCNAFCVQSCRS